MEMSSTVSLTANDPADNRYRYLVKDFMLERTTSSISAKNDFQILDFALELALAVACGDTLYGREVQRGEVLYVCEDVQTIVERVKAWQTFHGSDWPENLYINQLPSSLLTVLAFTESIKNLQPKLVVLDTLSRRAGDRANDSDADVDPYDTFLSGAKEAADGMKAICQATGAHVALVQADTESDSAPATMGSVRPYVDTFISLEWVFNKKEMKLVTRGEKRRGKPFAPFTLQSHNVILPFDGFENAEMNEERVGNRRSSRLGTS